uniref:DNA helicase n=1 Tax=Angiostrongylus cantonensis TaxID=6313 RepID=A0A158P689_ANGCA
MSRKNANASVPPSTGNHSSEYAGLIEWYDSPKVFLASQAKMLGSGRLVKARSAEDFSPSRSLVTDTPSTSDFDSLWCASSPQEDVKQFDGGDGNTATNLINGVSHDEPTSHPQSDPLKAVQQCSPNISPISSLSLLKGKDTVLTPSTARSKPPQFLTSTPKTTSLKRYQTVDNSAVKDEGVKRKIAHTKSMDIVDELSDDDSFLNDIFVPFTHPSQSNLIRAKNGVFDLPYIVIFYSDWL